MNTQVRIKELSIDSNGDVTIEGVEIDVTEKTLLDLVGFFLGKPEPQKEADISESPEESTASKKTIAATAVKPTAAGSRCICPECEAKIGRATAETMVSEILQCTDCGVELEITCLDPFTVELAPEEEEDWGE